MPETVWSGTSENTPPTNQHGRATRSGAPAQPARRSASELREGASPGLPMSPLVFTTHFPLSPHIGWMEPTNGLLKCPSTRARRRPTPRPTQRSRRYLHTAGVNPWSASARAPDPAHRDNPATALRDVVSDEDQRPHRRPHLRDDWQVQEWPSETVEEDGHRREDEEEGPTRMWGLSAARRTGRRHRPSGPSGRPAIGWPSAGGCIHSSGLHRHRPSLT